MNEPIWLFNARKYVGLQEIPGKTTAPQIEKWLRKLGAWWHDDETPWCGVFVGACLMEGGVGRPRAWFRARAYLDWGIPLLKPRVGCVVIFNGGKKRPGGGHVGFVVGQDDKGRLMVLGGNQGNAVSIAPFDRSRVLGYRWPDNCPPPTGEGLPLLAANGRPPSEYEG